MSDRAMSDRIDEPTDDEPAKGEAALLAQQEMLESSLELVFETWDGAQATKMNEPVVFLLDCEDPIGRQIANAWLGAENVSDAIAERQLEDPSDESTTVYARAFSWADCQHEIPEVFPYLAPVFDEPAPTDGLLAIAVTAGGASAFTVPPSARDLE